MVQSCLWPWEAVKHIWNGAGYRFCTGGPHNLWQSTQDCSFKHQLHVVCVDNCKCTTGAMRPHPAYPLSNVHWNTQGLFPWHQWGYEVTETGCLQAWAQSIAEKQTDLLLGCSDITHQVTKSSPTEIPWISTSFPSPWQLRYKEKLFWIWTLFFPVQTFVQTVSPSCSVIRCTSGRSQTKKSYMGIFGSQMMSCSTQNT